jgi:hypothetical protein
MTGSSGTGLPDETPSSADPPNRLGQERERLTRRRFVGASAAAAGAAIVWGSPFPFSRKGIGQSIESAYATAAPTGPTGPQSTSTSAARGPDRAGYCSVAGNTFPDGTPIPPGTFLNLEVGQPDRDPYYKGATPANFIEGVGITCDPPPEGYVRDGFATDAMHVPGGIYPYWRKSS